MKRFASKEQAKKSRKPRASRLPEPRGRRGHPLLDEIPGLRAWFELELTTTPSHTIDSLQARLKDTGFWKPLQDLGHESGVSRGTLAKERINFEQRKARRELTVYLAEQYNSGEIDILEIDTAISGMISVELSAELEKTFAKGNGFTEKATELANAFRLQLAAHTNLERAKMFINRGVAKAEVKILSHVLEVMKRAAPSARQELLDAIRSGAAEARK